MPCARVQGQALLTGAARFAGVAAGMLCWCARRQLSWDPQIWPSSTTSTRSASRVAASTLPCIAVLLLTRRALCHQTSGEFDRARLPPHYCEMDSLHWVSAKGVVATVRMCGADLHDVVHLIRHAAMAQAKSKSKEKRVKSLTTGEDLDLWAYACGVLSDPWVASYVNTGALRRSTGAGGGGAAVAGAGAGSGAGSGAGAGAGTDRIPGSPARSPLLPTPRTTGSIATASTFASVPRPSPLPPSPGARRAPYVPPSEHRPTRCAVPGCGRLILQRPQGPQFLGCTPEHSDLLRRDPGHGHARGGDGGRANTGAAPQCAVAGCSKPATARRGLGTFFRGCSPEHTAVSNTITAAAPAPVMAPVCGVDGCARAARRRPDGTFFRGCTAAHSRSLSGPRTDRWPRLESVPVCCAEGCGRPARPRGDGTYFRGCCAPHSSSRGSGTAYRGGTGGGGRPSGLGGAAPTCGVDGCSRPAKRRSATTFFPGCSQNHSMLMQQQTGDRRWR